MNKRTSECCAVERRRECRSGTIKGSGCGLCARYCQGKGKGKGGKEKEAEKRGEEERMVGMKEKK